MKFVGILDKKTLLRHLKEKATRINIKDIVPNGTDLQIYISEYLSPENALLFKEARILRKNEKARIQKEKGFRLNLIFKNSTIKRTRGKMKNSTTATSHRMISKIKHLKEQIRTPNEEESINQIAHSSQKLTNLLLTS